MQAIDPFARQRVLREIGDRGQARLEAANFTPNPALSPAAGQIARHYARAAGFPNEGPPEPASGEPVANPLAKHFRHSAAADVGLAAADVLSQSLPHFDLQA